MMALSLPGPTLFRRKKNTNEARKSFTLFPAKPNLPQVVAPLRDKSFAIQHKI
jgi:hypothetical protein